MAPPLDLPSRALVRRAKVLCDDAWMAAWTRVEGARAAVFVGGAWPDLERVLDQLQLEVRGGRGDALVRQLARRRPGRREWLSTPAADAPGVSLLEKLARLLAEEAPGLGRCPPDDRRPQEFLTALLPGAAPGDEFVRHLLVRLRALVGEG